MYDEFYKIGIIPKNNRRSQKVVCPNCVKIGKTHIQDTCLSIDLFDGLYNCHKCGWSGKVFTQEFKPMEITKVYQKPNKKNLTKLSDEALKYLESRGINQSVINANKLASANNGNSIVFPYFRDGELINYKTRLINEKKFFQAQDAEPIMYNLDRLKDCKEIIYTEGEIDCLSLEVAGYTNVTSVNQGAPNANDKNIDKKLECLTNSIDILELAETHILCFDKDANGKRLEQEFIRRLGAENCKIVDLKDCKDANEYLLLYGTFELSNAIKNAKEVKVEGVFTINDEMDSLLQYYEQGDLASESTYIDVVDKAWKWRSKEVTVWTGYQNEGKSLFLNQLCLLKAIMDGDKFAFFTPENMPLRDFFADLICTYIGKPADPRFHSRMTKEEYITACATIGNYFYMIYPEANFSLDIIFEKAKYLIRKKGIKHLIIDPYNTIEHNMKPGEREDLYISRFMGQLKRFAIDNDITIQLVAHQLTARPNPNNEMRYYKPNLNSIKGGGTMADKTDNACFVWRPNRALDFSDRAVTFGSQKIKKQRLVGIPQDIENITFDLFSQRYLFNGYSPFAELDKQRNNYFDKQELPKIKPLDAFGIPQEDDNDVPF